MKRFISFIVVALYCGSGFAGDPAMLKLETDKVVVPGSVRVYEIYTEMLTRLRFPNQAGHTMAAGVLAKCIGPATVADHLIAYQDTIKALTISKSLTIRCGMKDLTPQMTYVAAVLTCKRLTRTPGQMLTNLEVVYGGLLADRWADWPPNVVVAADLML